jgi:hypothetical protein
LDYSHRAILPQKQQQGDFPISTQLCRPKYPLAAFELFTLLTLGQFVTPFTQFLIIFSSRPLALRAELFQNAFSKECPLLHVSPEPASVHDTMVGSVPSSIAFRAMY